jgi:type VI secretion system protein ImpK
MGKRKHRFSFQDVQDTYKRLFERSEKVLDNSSFQRDDYFLARFALCAWIDEKVLTSSWDEKQHWPTEELQRQFYKTTNAGEEFYDLLRKLTAEQTQVKEVFSVCMELGFQGRYFGRYGKEELDEIRKKVRTELLGSNPSPAALVAHGNKLVPQAYQKSRPSKKTDLSWLGNIAITLILMAISLLLVVGVYVWAVNDVSRQKSKLFPNLVSVPKDTSGSKSGSNSSD